jgi:ABC-type Fe3+-siderophore transport system permease subunit
MLNARVPRIKTQPLVGLSLFVLGTWLAWSIGERIAAQDLSTVEYYFMGFAACVVAVAILRNWRLGLYFTLVWVLFEDLTRKFLGNNMAIYFAKDVLVGLVYMSLLVDIRSGRVKVFRPPFLTFLMVFVWFGILQLFNPHSPHILYGLMGIKIYFY